MWPDQGHIIGQIVLLPGSFGKSQEQFETLSCVQKISVFIHVLHYGKQDLKVQGQGSLTLNFALKIRCQVKVYDCFSCLAIVETILVRLLT